MGEYIWPRDNPEVKTRVVAALSLLVTAKVRIIRIIVAFSLLGIIRIIVALSLLG